MSARDIPTFLSISSDEAGDPDILYGQTSQARRWYFTSAQLEEMRQAVHAGAVSRVLQKSQGQASAHGAPLAASPPESESLLWLVRFYTSKIPGLCKAFRFPLSVDAAACAFMHRFYLRHSPIEYSPKDVMLTCLYLASKTENATLTLKEFAGRIAAGSSKPAVNKRPSVPASATSNGEGAHNAGSRGGNQQQAPPLQALHAQAANAVSRAILQLEFAVCQALNFEFAIHGAHRALAGILIDLALILPAGTAAELGELLTRSDQAVKSALQVATGPARLGSTRVPGNEKGPALVQDPSEAAEMLYRILPVNAVEKAYSLLVDARLSDVDLLFSPVQIAYAVFRLAVSRSLTQAASTDPKRMAETNENGGSQPAVESRDPSLALGKMWFHSLEARASRAAQEHGAARDLWLQADKEATGPSGASSGATGKAEEEDKNSISNTDQAQGKRDNEHSKEVPNKIEYHDQDQSVDKNTAASRTSSTTPVHPLGLTFDQLELVAKIIWGHLDNIASGRQSHLKPDELRKCDQCLQAFLGHNQDKASGLHASQGAKQGVKRDGAAAGLEEEKDGGEQPISKLARTDA